MEDDFFLDDCECKCRCCGCDVKWFEKICDFCYKNEYEKEVKKAVRYGRRTL